VTDTDSAYSSCPAQASRRNAQQRRGLVKLKVLFSSVPSVLNQAGRPVGVGRDRGFVPAAATRDVTGMSVDSPAVFELCSRVKPKTPPNIKSDPQS
jgi:hypothetical protein